MYSFEPIPSEKFKKFIERTLCEARGSRYGRLIYLRFDLKKPIQFKEEGFVPVTEIEICLRTLGITKEKYLSTLDELFQFDSTSP